MFLVLNMQQHLSSMSEMQNMSNDQVYASSVHVVCICDAWSRHDQAHLGQSV